MKTITFNQIKELPYSIQEAVNRLRVNFGFCGSDYKKVLITSSTPDEGKSFVSFQLWCTLAEAGSRVVMVDADIRKSMWQETYQMTCKEGNLLGLAHYLSGQAAMSDVIYQTNIPNAYIVPTTYTISNPAILLQNGRLEKLLNALSQEFDYVLVDTPPLDNVSDGGQIASYCDGALLVVRSGVTPRGVVASSMKQLERANCRLMGTVLNRVEKKQNAYYYRKYAKYGYGYGYGYGETSKKEQK